MSNVLSATSGPVSGSFSYDGNGNAITDGRRNITAIAYNQLNLPSTVTAMVSGTPTQVAAYTYDASGTKLKSVQGATTREYISGIQYTNGVIDFVATEEGRAVRNPSTGAYHYEYTIKDHLGNARVSFDDNNGVARLIQEDEYYAFGLNRSLFNSGTKNNYLYNGKELQTALSEEYDYGARFYDPVIARWQTIDPLAESYQSVNPYNYADNNPMSNTDPDGRYVLYGASAQAFFGILKQKPYNPPKKNINVNGEILRGILLGFGIKDELYYNGKAYWGTNFIGPGPTTDPAKLGLDPKDMVDQAAYEHDVAYFKARVGGASGALLSLKVAAADKKLANAALSVIKKYGKGGYDPVTRDKISERTYKEALLVYKLFSNISDTKNSRIKAYENLNSRINNFNSQLGNFANSLNISNLNVR